MGVTIVQFCKMFKFSLSSYECKKLISDVFLVRDIGSSNSIYGSPQLYTPARINCGKTTDK